VTRFAALVTRFAILVTRFVALVTRFVIFVTCFAALVTRFAIFVTRFVALVATRTARSSIGVQHCALVRLCMRIVLHAECEIAFFLCRS
jgi:hypothetical protein